MLLSRDVLRLGIGLLLVITAVDLASRAADVADGSLAEIALAITTAVVGAAVAWLAVRARAAATFELPAGSAPRSPMTLAPLLVVTGVGGVAALVVSRWWGRGLAGRAGPIAGLRGAGAGTDRGGGAPDGRGASGPRDRVAARADAALDGVVSGWSPSCGVGAACC